MSQVKTLRELREIVRRDAERFGELATLWNDLTIECQDELLTLATLRVEQLNTADKA